MCTSYFKYKYNKQLHKKKEKKNWYYYYTVQHATRYATLTFLQYVHINYTARRRLCDCQTTTGIPGIQKVQKKHKKLYGYINIFSFLYR